MRQIGKYALVFIFTYLILACSLVAVATIPREAIRPKMLESVDYMYERPTKERLIPFRSGSFIDRFADCYTLSIAYYLDENHPLESAMWAKYYGPYTLSASFFLRFGVTQALEANNQYLRYWHGSAVPIRLMHLFWNIRSIYCFHAVVMGVLLVLLLGQLWRHGLRAEAVCLLASLIVVDIYFVPLCLEYTWMFLVMLAAANIAVFRALRGKDDFGCFFLVVGMVSAFLDFLTTETLTLLIPLLLILRIQSRREQYEPRYFWKTTIVYGIVWFIGFAGMWAMKWLTASVVLGENVMPYVLDHISMRLDGGNVNFTTAQYMKEAVLRNIRCLPFYEYGIGGAAALLLLLFGLVLLPVMLNKVRMRKSISWSQVILYLCLSFVPYIRYMILHNHSYYHSFAYRAQAASILALCFAIMEVVEIHRRTTNASQQTITLPEN